MLSNPGLTCEVKWKSCSDCKAAWGSIRLLHCLSVTWDKLPNTVRAPVNQVHYNNTAESDYRWQLGIDKHILYCTAVVLNSVLLFICLEIGCERPWLPQVHSSCTWQKVRRFNKFFKFLIFSKEQRKNMWHLITTTGMGLFSVMPDFCLASGHFRPVNSSLERDTKERTGTTKHLIKKKLDVLSLAV